MVAYNGDTAHTPSNEEVVLTAGDGPDTRMGTITWFIIILVIILILIIILILVCLIKRNRGGKYPVQKKVRGSDLVSFFGCDHSIRGRVRPSVRPYVPCCFRMTNMAVFEG